MLPGLLWTLAIASAAVQGAFLPRSGFLHLPEPFHLFGRDESPPNDDTCMLPNPSDLPKRSLSLTNYTELLDHLIPRAGKVNPQPLTDPKTGPKIDSDKAFEDFLQTIKGLPGKEPPSTTKDIPIKPSKHQLDVWKAHVRRQDIPIGATSVYYPFEGKRDFWMHDLSGCTSVFITAPKGMWVLHLWENTREQTLNGGSAFLKRTSGTTAFERSDEEFKAVALDILSERTPDSRAKDRGVFFESLADLAEVKKHLDPFKNGHDVQMFILTKAKSPKNRDQKYAKKITQLKSKLTDIIPHAQIIEKTYANSDPGVHKDMRGQVYVQYTPFEDRGKDGCSPQARVRIFYENNKTAALDRKWPSLSINKRNSCPLKPT